VKNYSCTRWSLVGLAVSSLLYAGGAVAQQGGGSKMSWGLTAGYGYDSNARREELSAESEGYATVGLNLNLATLTPRLDASLAGGVRYEDRELVGNGSNVYGNLAAALKYALIPERLFWTVQDTYGQTLGDPRGTNSPDNLRNTNFFTTGPDLTLRFGGSTGMSLSGRYSRTDTEGELFTGLPGNTPGFGNSVGDDQRLEGTLGVFKEFSKSAQVSLNASTQRVEFRTTGNPGYDFQSYYAQFKSDRARYSYNLDAGVTELHDFGTTERMPLVRANFYRRLGPSGSFTLSAGQEFRNGADIFRGYIENERRTSNLLFQGMDPVLVDALLNYVYADVSLSNRPAKYRYGRADVGYSRSRTTFSIGTGMTQERFQFVGIGAQRDTWDVNATLSRRLKMDSSLAFTVGMDERDFKGLRAKDSTQYAMVTLNWQLTRSWALNTWYRYETRDSDFATYSYDNSSAYIGVTYGSRR
jgi:hypothetical protein